MDSRHRPRGRTRTRRLAALPALLSAALLAGCEPAVRDLEDGGAGGAGGAGTTSSSTSSASSSSGTSSSSSTSSSSGAAPCTLDESTLDDCVLQ
jgi:hypothetical protein